MSSPIVFNIFEKKKIKSNNFYKERKLQNIVEENMYEIFGITFLESEYSFSDPHLGKGRIDSIGIDDEGRPVIFEYKLTENENVINQALYYMDWLRNHSAEFELLTLKKLGNNKHNELLPNDKKNISLRKPRAICIAKNFNRYDKGAINQMNVDIELYQYYLYDENSGLIAFELVNSIDNLLDTNDNRNHDNDKLDLTYIQNIYENLDLENKKFVDKIIFQIQSISDGISFIWKEKHANFKTTNIFAALVINKKDGIKITLPIDYDKHEMEKYSSFIRDVKNVGHYGNGDVEIKIKNDEELDIAMPFIIYSYERNS